jgi:hypothetical protein
MQVEVLVQIICRRRVERLSVVEAKATTQIQPEKLVRVARQIRVVVEVPAVMAALAS